MAANNYFGFPPGYNCSGNNGTPYQTPSQNPYTLNVASGSGVASTSYGTTRPASFHSTSFQGSTRAFPVAPSSGNSTQSFDYNYPGGRSATATGVYDNTKAYYQATGSQQATMAPSVPNSSNTDYQNWQGGANTYGAASGKSFNYGQQQAQVKTPSVQSGPSYMYGNQQTGNYSYGSGNSLTSGQAKPQGNVANKPTAAIKTGSNISTGSASVAGGSGSGYQTPYEAALMTAATSLYMQGGVGGSGGSSAGPRPSSGGNFNNRPRPGFGAGQAVRQHRPYRPPKPQQMHYCDVCKISCAGPAAYQDHLNGQRHKKKMAKTKTAEATSSTAAAVAAPARTTNNSSSPVFVCELCDVECTATDAYAAHLRGSKHSKVMKLHTRMGKPIPPPDPRAAKAVAMAQDKSASSSTSNFKMNVTMATTKEGSKVPIVTPKITFVAAGAANVSQEPTASTSAAAGNNNAKGGVELEMETTAAVFVDDRPIVGLEFIEEEKDSAGKLITFNCKLCDCKFSDPNAKEMHMKGRRHRLQYKKKVDHTLDVDVKINPKNKKRLHFPKPMPMLRKKNLNAGGGVDVGYEESCRRYEKEMRDYTEWCRNQGMMPPPSAAELRQHLPPPMRGLGMVGSGGRMIPNQAVLNLPPLHVPPVMPMPHAPHFKPENPQDRFVLARYKETYPTEEEVRNVVHIIADVESVVKMVSDDLMKKARGNSNEEKDEDEIPTLMPKEDEGCLRTLVGVQRVNDIAKGLLLAGDSVLEFTIQCSVKPTLAMHKEVGEALPIFFETVAEAWKKDGMKAAYSVESKADEAGYLVNVRVRESNEEEVEDESVAADVEEHDYTVLITMTSALVRGELLSAKNEDKATIGTDPPDVFLSKTKCLDALAAVRHAKWFQARVAPMQNCVVLIRIMKDLSLRQPVWYPLNGWPMELLCEKVFSTHNNVWSAGEGLKRMMQLLASGLLMYGSLLDPCEKDPVDAAAHLTAQEREDITHAAQLAIRRVWFRQIGKILEMETPPPSFSGNYYSNRKRRRSGGLSEEGGKKDKKEEDGSQMEEDADKI